MDSEKPSKKTIEGVVVSNRMPKTIVVINERKVKHPLYQKVVRITKKYKAHDEGNICSIGDKVRLMEVRPLSAGKRWALMKVLEKGRTVIEEEDKGMPAPVRRKRETAEAHTKEKKIDTAQV